VAQPDTSRLNNPIEASLERELVSPFPSPVEIVRTVNESRLEGMLEAAFERSEELLLSSIQPALADSGVYSGTVLWESRELLLQRVSSAMTILHAKGMLNDIPEVGKSVRIAYSNGLGTVQEIVRERNSRELER